MDKKIKISFLVPSLKGGGAERNIINITNSLGKGRYQISIVAGNIGGDLKQDIGTGINVVSLGCSNVLALVFRFRAYLKKEKPDILVSSLTHINILSMMARTLAGVPTKVILIEHTTLSLLPATARTFGRRFTAKFILPYFIKFFYPSAEAIVCVSKGVADDLSGVIGNLKTIKVIYNPVVQENFYSKAKEPLGEDEHFFKTGKPVIIAVGRLIRAKDYPNLLKALKIVLQNIQAHLIILGEGPEEENLKKMVLALGIEKNVSFLGFKPNPYKYLANSSLFVLSSFREGFGNVIVEAMACGIPVVATDCKSGPNEIIENGKSGILVPVQNEQALASAISKILDDPSLSQKISEAGRERAKYFSVEKSVREYENLFREILR